MCIAVDVQLWLRAPAIRGEDRERSPWGKTKDQPGEGIGLRNILHFAAPCVPHPLRPHRIDSTVGSQAIIVPGCLPWRDACAARPWARCRAFCLSRKDASWVLLHSRGCIVHAENHRPSPCVVTRAKQGASGNLLTQNAVLATPRRAHLEIQFPPVVSFYPELQMACSGKAFPFVGFVRFCQSWFGFRVYPNSLLPPGVI